MSLSRSTTKRSSRSRVQRCLAPLLAVVKPSSLTRYPTRRCDLVITWGILAQVRRLIWDRLIVLHHPIARMFVREVGDLASRFLLDPRSPLVNDGLLLWGDPDRCQVGRAYSRRDQAISLVIAPLHKPSARRMFQPLPRRLQLRREGAVLPLLVFGPGNRRAEISKRLEIAEKQHLSELGAAKLLVVLCALSDVKNQLVEALMVESQASSLSQIVVTTS